MRFTRTRIGGASIAAASVMLACSDVQDPGSRVVSPQVQRVDERDPVVYVARAFALALRDAGVRDDVLQAMRASPYDEHKVTLRDFLKTPAGASVLAAARMVGGSSVAELDSKLAILPDMDFYMPVREHRRAWRGDANVAVVAAVDGPDNVPGYTPAGGVLSVSRRTAEGLPPFFFLAPAETKGRRVNPQRSDPGQVIEDANDGAGSASFVWREPGGEATIIDFADPDAQTRFALVMAGLSSGRTGRDPGDMTVQVCACGDPCEPQPEGCEEPPPPSAPADTTRLARFEHFMCDNGYCWTDAEVRINGQYYSATGSLLGTGEFKRGGVTPGVAYYWTDPVIFKRIRANTNEYINMILVEEDRHDTGGFNNDDNCGTMKLVATSSGVPQRYKNTSACTGGVDEGYLGGYSAEIVFYWTTKY